MRSVYAIVAAALVSAASAGCADEAVPLPAAAGADVPKSFFTDAAHRGEVFFSRVTVTDVQSGGPFVAGWASPLRRVRWSIDERTLIARADEGAVATDGAIVHAWAITDQYDKTPSGAIDRSRPWFEREYMAVDWSRDLVSVQGLDLLEGSIAADGTGVAYAALRVVGDEPLTQPVLDVDAGYLDVTGRLSAAAGTVSIAGTDVPACAVGPAGVMPEGIDPQKSSDCVREIDVRTSFVRAADAGYAPGSGSLASAFAAPVVRFPFEYDFPREPLSIRRPLWQRDLAAAPDGSLVACDPSAGDADADGTDDACVSVGRGARCNASAAACTLPFAARSPRTFAFHYVGPDEHAPAVRAALLPWDVALRSAIAAARYLECTALGDPECASRFPVPAQSSRDDDDAVALASEVLACREGRAHLERGGDAVACAGLADELATPRAASKAAVAIARAEPAIVLCHDPIAAADPAPCGQAGLRVRDGDVRFDVIRVDTGVGDDRPELVAVPGFDPTTGAIVSSRITVALLPLIRRVAAGVDWLELAAGELADGPAAAAHASGLYRAAREGALPRLDATGLVERLGAFAGVDAQGFTAIAHHAKSDPAVAAEVAKVLDRAASVVGVVRPAAMVTEADERRAAARGTDVDLALAQAAASSAAVDGAWDQELSPLGPFAAAVSGRARGAIADGLARRAACVLAGPNPATLVPLLPVLFEKFGPPTAGESATERLARTERVRSYLVDRSIEATISHAVGHALGLGHNLAGSADARFYHPQYWQLRTRDGAAAGACDGSSSAPCSGPRYVDPADEGELDQQIGMFATSSVLDVLGDARAALVGPGAFDFAAVRGLYAEVVPVFAEPERALPSDLGAGFVAELDDFGGVWGKRWRQGDREVEAASLQRHERLVRDCVPVDTDALRPASWDESARGPWSPLLDGGIVRAGGQATRCRQPALDLVAWAALAGAAGASAASDAQGRVRAPFLVASDDVADAGNPSANRGDAGADAYEVATFFATFDQLEAVRTRDDHGTESDYLERLARLQRQADLAAGPALLASFIRDAALDLDGTSFDDAIALAPRASLVPRVLAADVAFEHLARLALRPVEGPHARPVGDAILRPIPADAAGAEIALPASVALVDDEISLAGRAATGGLERIWAAELLASSTPWLFFDGVLPTSVALADAWPRAFERWLGAAASGDESVAAPRVASWANGSPVVDASLSPSKPLGWVRWAAPNEPELCFPSHGREACTTYASVAGEPADPSFPPFLAALDPGLDAHAQRLAIAWTLLHAPASGAPISFDALRVWSSAVEPPPPLAHRIELHAPDGEIWIAQTDGADAAFGAAVQRRVAARILQRANTLLASAYEVAPGPDLDADGAPDWWLPVLDASTGKPHVKYHPAAAGPGCSPEDASACACDASPICVAFARQLEVVRFLRSALDRFGG